jgi:adenosine deaminase
MTKKKMQNRFHYLTKKIPKCELHCHLTGSIRQTTLLELIRNRVPERELECFKNETWDDAMKIFPLIHKAVYNQSSLRRVIYEAIVDMKNDGVVYIEFRITLKEMPTKREFLQFLVKEIRASARKCDGIDVRLIVSVARHESVESAMKSADIAIEHFKKQKSNGILVGFELCGNPNIGKWDDFLPVFSRVRLCGLKIALHFAENHNEAEHHAMLDFMPNRLGHAVFANPNVLCRVRSLSIPVETCLSCHEEFYGVKIPSNVFSELFPQKHPISLNSDNPLLQKTMPSVELAKALNVFSGRLINSEDDFLRLVLDPFDHAFGDTAKLRDKVRLEIERKGMSEEWMGIVQSRLSKM